MGECGSGDKAVVSPAMTPGLRTQPTQSRNPKQEDEDASMPSGRRCAVQPVLRNVGEASIRRPGLIRKTCVDLSAITLHARQAASPPRPKGKRGLQAPAQAAPFDMNVVHCVLAQPQMGIRRQSAELKIDVRQDTLAQVGYQIRQISES